MPSIESGIGIPARSRTVGADVGHVGVVAADRARVADPARPVHDQRVPRAAEMRGDLLAPVERGVARPRPPGRVVRSELLAAPGLEAAVLEEEPHLLLGRERDPVQRRQLVERARERALHAGAVVAPDPDHDGVLELAHLVDRVDDPADVPVGVLGVARVDLHLTRVEALVRLVERVPASGTRRCAAAAPRPRGRRRAPSAARTSARASRPSPRRTCPGTCPTTRAARGAARGCSRSRRRRTTASSASRSGPREASRSSCRRGRPGSSTARRPWPRARR